MQHITCHYNEKALSIQQSSCTERRQFRRPVGYCCLQYRQTALHRQKDKKKYGKCCGIDREKLSC